MSVIICIALLPAPESRAEEAATKSKRGPQYQLELHENNRLSINSAGAPIDQLLAGISELTGVQFIAAEPPRDSIHLDVGPLPMEKALNRLLGDRNVVAVYGPGPNADALHTILTEVWILDGVSKLAGSGAKRIPSALQALPKEDVDEDSFENVTKRALRSKKASQRIDAVEQLVGLDEELAKDILVQVLGQDRDPRVREAAVENLLWYEENTPKGPLREAALNDKDAGVRLHAIEEGFAEWAEDDPTSRKVLATALRDSSKQVRIVALEALSALATSDGTDPVVTNALKAAAKDKDAEIRITAVEALGDAEDREALVEIWKRDTDRSVQEAAETAIDNLDN